MKRINIPFMLVALMMGSLLFLDSCKNGGDDPGPKGDDEKTRVTKLLTAGTWSMQSLTIDGVAKADMLTGLKITFTGTAFTATNGDPVWPATGTWMFDNAEAKIFSRNDLVKVIIESISETALTASLTWSKKTMKAGGRTESVAGKHVFVFGK